MNYQLTGNVKLINETQTFSSGFSKRELIVSVEDGNYVQDICLEFIKDKADLLNDLSPGDEVTVSFNIKGREYNGRYFNNLQGWKIEKGSGGNMEDDNSSNGNGVAPGASSGFSDEDVPF